MKVDSIGCIVPYLGRIVAPADFPHTVRRLTVRLDKMRHPDDFILPVILGHIRLLDDRHEILGMANLSLQTFPDLMLPRSVSLHRRTKDDNGRMTSRNEKARMQPT
jgi:hypothetical protein